ncbi:MAG: peptidoglycan DD-metalloendopeptidase family protein [Muribaculaceae bacterium]|nr:peptidoglycan DD-metalloendopeptidase family protein [Muribaculaceae bacterium]MDE6786516.1 peptidoglycan DD-metalloendopeptidase family protein [Muribaculaceae bacterium]
MKKLNTIICCALLSIVPFAMTAQKKGASHAAAHKQLLANAASSKDKIKLIEQNTFIDLIDDDLEPELDIYTEGWNSKSVNPFNEKDVPNTQVIDVRGFTMPHNGPLTSPYGYRKRFGRMHKGVDIGIKSNDTICAAFEGKVRLTAYEGGGYGNYIIVRHPNGLETVYGHLNKHLVKPGDVVRAGDPIGLGGSTGRSTGPHLHFETRFMGYAINPAAIVDFANKTTHTDEYTFSKTTYTKARNFAPSKSKRELAADDANTYKSGNSQIASYTVKKGDTINKIARAHGMSATSLRKLNGLETSDAIKIGQELRLK